MTNKGYIHVYTGNGKGKTTAALGLSLRAAGTGKKIFFAQFIKGKSSSEIDAINKFIPNITIKQYGLDCFIVKIPTENDIRAANEGLKEISHILSAGLYDIVVLDEATIAVYYKLFSSQELIKILKTKKDKTEIIITGRYAPPELIEIADLVTEMKEIKHYYSKGINARKGIEY
jgi:cob(I)alamin adenosyltransferase